MTTKARCPHCNGTKIRRFTTLTIDGFPFFLCGVVKCQGVWSGRAKKVSDVLAWMDAAPGGRAGFASLTTADGQGMAAAVREAAYS